MAFDTTAFATALLSTRNRLNMTIDGHATALREAGIDVSMSALHRYETAQAKPRITFFLAVCKHYKLDPFQFISREAGA